MNNAPVAGSLEIICGPMFSGKSEELIRRLRRIIIARQDVAVFKYNLDTRYSINNVVSHNGSKIHAQPIENVDAIINSPHTIAASVIGIDEVQFFPQEIIEVICTLISQGKRVIVAGLDLDFRGIPFGPIPMLLAIADHVTKLQAICCHCGKDAHFTQRLVNNVPARFDDPIILIGAQESYQARCRLCYTIDKTPIFYEKQNIL